MIFKTLIEPHCSVWGFMCVRTLLSGLCGELQLTREDLGPATYTVPLETPVIWITLGSTGGPEQGTIYMTQNEEDV